MPVIDNPTPKQRVVRVLVDPELYDVLQEITAAYQQSSTSDMVRAMIRHFHTLRPPLEGSSPADAQGANGTHPSHSAVEP